ncbi:hypothetical protein B0H16DRAFT_1691850 [Mycena metata]|uniref:Uncharacterized protein n=1 Tax=Mycena metata TaxID=1033252 RepID=A0AAD7IS63_9AGAR|nr:hypothetical protein B0H16DRAFT_1691850 [Mycena metata]
MAGYTQEEVGTVIPNTYCLVEIDSELRGPGLQEEKIGCKKRACTQPGSNAHQWSINVHERAKDASDAMNKNAYTFGAGLYYSVARRWSNLYFRTPLGYTSRFWPHFGVSKDKNQLEEDKLLVCITFVSFLHTQNFVFGSPNKNFWAKDCLFELAEICRGEPSRIEAGSQGPSPVHYYMVSGCERNENFRTLTSFSETAKSFLTATQTFGGGVCYTLHRHPGPRFVYQKLEGVTYDVLWDRWHVTYLSKEQLASSRIQTPDQLIELGLAPPLTSESSDFLTNQKFLLRKEGRKCITAAVPMRKQAGSSRTKPILGDEQMSRSALLGTPQLSKGDRLTGLRLRDGNVSDTKVRYGPERSARRSEPEWTGDISKKQETTRSRTTVVGMAERELRRRDRRSGDVTEERRRPESRREPERDGSKAITREMSRGNEQETMETMETVGNSP